MKISKMKVMLILAEKGMTWTALAQSAGIAKGNLSILMSRGTCAPATAGKLAKGLGVAIREILEEES